MVENYAKGGKKALRAKAINELVGELLGPALKDDHGLEPIGQPSLVESPEELSKTFTPGEELEVKVKRDVWPEIRWKTKGEGEDEKKPYLGLTGTYKRKPFDQVKLDTAIRELLERYVTLEPIDDTDHQLTTSDACVVDMAGYLATDDGEKGEPLPEGVASGDSVEVILGEGRYMEGLVEGLEGGKVGEVKTVKVTFPQVRTAGCCLLNSLNLSNSVEVIYFSKLFLPDFVPSHSHSHFAGTDPIVIRQLVSIVTLIHILSIAKSMTCDGSKCNLAARESLPRPPKRDPDRSRKRRPRRQRRHS